MVIICKREIDWERMGICGFGGRRGGFVPPPCFGHRRAVVGRWREESGFFCRTMGGLVSRGGRLRETGPVG